MWVVGDWDVRRGHDASVIPVMVRVKIVFTCVLAREEARVRACVRARAHMGIWHELVQPEDTVDSRRELKRARLRPCTRSLVDIPG